MAKESKAEPKVFLKSQASFNVHTFKGEVATLLKNDAYKHEQPVIRDIEHVHYYHSKNSQGRAQDKTCAVAGHYHEIKWDTDKDGNLIAHCSIPYTGKKVKLPNGDIRFIKEPVKYYDGNRGQYIEDTHTHKMTYVGSDTMSPELVSNLRKENQSVVAQLAPEAQQAILQATSKAELSKSKLSDYEIKGLE